MKLFLMILGIIYLAIPSWPQEVQDRLTEISQLYFSGQPIKAMEDYTALSKETQNRQAFLNAAFIALEQNQPKRAVDIMVAAYRIYPQDTEILELLAEAFLSDGQYAAAERILSLLPENSEKAGFYYINLARTQLGLEERELAKYNLKMAARAGTHTALANYLLGTLQSEDKKYAEAAKCFEKAVAHDPQFTEARLAWAEALEKSGKPEDAFRQYRTLYAAEKHNERITQAYTRLKAKFPNVKAESTSSKITVTTPPSHTTVTPLPREEGYTPQEIKIGLGVQQNGRPSVRSNITFSLSDDFSIQNSKGIMLTRGKAGEIWKIVLEKRKPFILTPKGKKIPFKKTVTIVPISNDDTRVSTIILKDIVSGAGMTWMNVSDKEYRGKLQVSYHSGLNTLIPINIVTMDEYLQGVISSEMPTTFPLEALKAQAVLARTYALKHKNKHKRYGFDVCDSQNCQVYGGVSAETERGNRAVSSTLGEVLLYEDKPIESVFSANTGGITQSAKDAGWSETPYLHSVSDYKNFGTKNLQPYQFRELLQYPIDSYSRYDKNVSKAAFRWTRVVRVEDLQKMIKRKKKDIGTIVALVPLRRSASGYVSKLVIKGTKGEVVLNKENMIRANLSWGLLRSSFFVIEPNYEKHKLKYFVFYGGGWGHGVGFDQTGAAGRAEEGQDYQTILKHYFPLADFYSPVEMESVTESSHNITFLGEN